MRGEIKMERQDFQMPFLSNSPPMMREVIIKSKRLPEIEKYLGAIGVFDIQRLYLKLFTKLERRYIEDNWRALGITELLRTKYPHEKLPLNWFREND